LWWLSVIFADSVEILYLGRFLSGLTAGGAFVLIPLYISEISEDLVRGVLGSFFIFSINVGTLLMLIAGAFLNYTLVPKLMISLPIIFIFTFVFLPETPQYLLNCGKLKQAENSLKFLRGCKKGGETPDKVKSELLEMSKKVEEDSEINQSSSILNELSKFQVHVCFIDFNSNNLIAASKVNRKALFIGLVLVAVNQLCGCFAFINYAAEIFLNSGSTLSPNTSAIVVGIIQVFASIISAFAIGRMSRKLLFSLTCFCVVVGLAAFGIHGYLQTSYDLSDYAWVPIASLSFVILFATIGLLPLTFVMLSEILPLKVSFVLFFA
jgi:MFS family permease